MAAIGLMGGTFDPIHCGHLILGEQAAEQLGLDTVLYVTTPNPPHKDGLAITDARHRFEMTRLAVDGNERFVCSDIEMRRAGPCYTVDTVREIRGLYGPEPRVYVLVGADEAAALTTWRDPRGLQELATVVVANRPGYEVEEVLARLPVDLAAGIMPLSIPGVDISATDLRNRVRGGRSIRYLVPEPVRRYIVDSGLYRGNE